MFVKPEGLLGDLKTAANVFHHTVKAKNQNFDITFLLIYMFYIDIWN